MDKNYKITRHVCPRNCYSSCTMLGYTRNRKLVKVTGDKKHGYTKGKLCPKGYNYLSHVYHPERLKFPMIQSKRGSGEWNRISWDEAIDIIAAKIIQLYDRFGTNLSLALNKYSGNFGILHNSVEGFFNSLGETSRAVGSPCWSSGLDASIYDFGAYKNSEPEQLRYADTIILWGSNPVWTSIHSVPFLYEAKKRGAKIITIDPVYTATAKKSDIYVQIKPGTDGAMALALAKVIYEENGLDTNFIDNYTTGFDVFLNYLNSVEFDELLKECGLEKEIIEEIAKTIIQGKNTMVWIGFGFQRNKNGGQNIRSINALMAMTGNIGKKGSGILYAQNASLKFTNNITKYFQSGFNEKNCVRSIPINDFASGLKEAKDPPIKMLWVSCRNLVTQNPDQKLLKKLLHNLDLIVTVDQFFTPTAQLSDIVLPAKTNFEEWDIVPSYWHHWIGINEPAIESYYESKSDLEIVKLLAKRLNELRLGFSTFPYEKTVEEFIEEQFTDEMYQNLGITNWRGLLEGPKRAPLPEIAWEDKNFETPSGKFEFYSERASENGKPPIAHYTFSSFEKNGDQLLLLTNHGQFNLNSQFHNLDLIDKGKREPIAFVHPSSGSRKGITNGSWVTVYNHNSELRLKCKFSYEVHPSVLLVQADHNLVNRLISFIPTDMGEVSSGHEGMAFNSTYVSIEEIGKG
ncbi:molybdopterin-dependent oxidoreductase [Bacillus sp. B15-48]|uniref:molybdopterin-dependent oxidoreductase n=1 Tax=Bacillus sp. B15-48 TaxID=1548601 RepID=UPI00193EFBC8|nr:molybdopterin-dependent oxidoreductase [Bacillus sp. B15-48]MBM4765249.1 molybdopterin-dependent oxidoreductase [Bacillus sp. B15-48]